MTICDRKEDLRAAIDKAISIAKKNDIIRLDSHISLSPNMEVLKTSTKKSRIR